MQIQFVHQPGATAAKVELGEGEACTAEAGAMIAMTGNMKVATTTRRRDQSGLRKAARRMLSGESLFLNHFEPSEGGGDLWLGSALVGDMMEFELDDESLLVQGGSFVACGQGVGVDLGWQGARTLLSGENMFWVRLSGAGKVIVNAFGAIYPIEVEGEYVVDTRHIVAFDDSLDFRIGRASKSWWHSFLGGEGLVCRFRGKGRVWCQSHNPESFGAALGPHLRERRVQRQGDSP
ncbi:uncharacterized protein (TIGR00266 family) [Halospina denitrificans]|uniref:Uncharacterized protein (TIGR00266 family) n=1 Tax=Halospina denitrificans TaxID=332522 RepID=A0A4R7JZF0_9GAMM|nr:TIGR00266 family protein [Halospina denitrificans]TDT43911.1 uncharacterized protein (TIGR00266 family) [Halospina denitrificans]